MPDFAHSVDEALEKFSLVTGAGNGQNTACAMSLLNWVWQNSKNGWSDSPECAHSLIRQIVIRANDDSTTTADDRKELVRLGEEGVLDTWWIPSEVIIAQLVRPKDTEPLSNLETAKKVLQGIAEWKGNKTGADLSGADLSGADLSEADLSRANLTGANLSRAYLTEANLYRANLIEADLSRANLTGANLSRAYLYGADLSRANLYRANLNGAYLSKANLSEANLTGAYLYKANLYRANLNGAINVPKEANAEQPS